MQITDFWNVVDNYCFCTLVFRSTSADRQCHVSKHSGIWECIYRFVKYHWYISVAQNEEITEKFTSLCELGIPFSLCFIQNGNPIHLGRLTFPEFPHFKPSYWCAYVWYFVSQYFWFSFQWHFTKFTIGPQLVQRMQFQTISEIRYFTQSPNFSQLYTFSLSFHFSCRKQWIIPRRHTT